MNIMAWFLVISILADLAKKSFSKKQKHINQTTHRLMDKQSKHCCLFQHVI